MNMTSQKQNQIESAKRTSENSPAIYRWERGRCPTEVREADDRSAVITPILWFFCRPFHGLWYVEGTFSQH